MGKFQQLRAKAISLRGAIAVGSAVVVAASMFQAADTLAAPDEVRQAKAGIATQNYFPTPLPDSISCSNDGVFLGNYAVISWTSAGAGMKYLVRIIRDNDDSKPANIIDEFFTVGTSHRFRTSATNKSDRVRIHTVNIASGETDSERAISTGYVSHTVHVPTVTYTNCSGGPRYDAPNADWENQYDWNPDAIAFAAEPSPSIFTTLLDDEAAADLLGELPEGDELASLDDATIDAAPATSAEATSAPSSTPASVAPSSPTSSESTTTTTSSGAVSSGERTTVPSASAPAGSSSPPPSTAAAAVTPASTQSTPSSSPTSTRARESIRAQVGDAPIAVGLSQARLEGVDGHTQLIITRNGGQVCTAEMDGASRIDSSDGELTVTVSGRTKSVDPETCKVD